MPSTRRVPKRQVWNPRRWLPCPPCHPGLVLSEHPAPPCITWERSRAGKGSAGTDPRPGGSPGLLPPPGSAVRPPIRPPQLPPRTRARAPGPAPLPAALHSHRSSALLLPLLFLLHAPSRCARPRTWLPLWVLGESRALNRCVSAPLAASLPVSLLLSASFSLSLGLSQARCCLRSSLAQPSGGPRRQLARRGAR